MTKRSNTCQSFRITGTGLKLCGANLDFMYFSEKKYFILVGFQILGTGRQKIRAKSLKYFIFSGLSKRIR